VDEAYYGPGAAQRSSPSACDSKFKKGLSTTMRNPSRPENGLSRQVPVPKSQSDSARISHTIFTRAQCDVAWKVFSNCNLWPGFSEIHGSNVQWHGAPWSAGSRLQFDIAEPEPTRVECVITLCAPPQCVAWIIHVCGHTFQQCVLFEPYMGGGTKITTWIELTNPDLGGGLTKVRLLLKPLLQTWFGNFTAECDHQARMAGSQRSVDPCSQE